MANRKLDDRPLWQKLLDPIRDHYQVDSPSDLEILRRLVHDHQEFVREIATLSATVQKQAITLARLGFVG